MENRLEGKVIEVIDDDKIVINKGAKDGVTADDRFLIYALGKEMTDPDTGESLGKLELVCGEGRPEHIQERITTLVSARIRERRTKRIVTKDVMSPLFGGTKEEIFDPETYVLPFENVKVGCLAKQIGR